LKVEGEGFKVESSKVPSAIGFALAEVGNGGSPSRTDVPSLFAVRTV
jgi:hypothetical protein